MNKIQPAREMLSLFGMADSQQALSKKTKSHGLAASLISAFLIVIFLSAVLKISTVALSADSTASASPVVNAAEEPVAFVPGQFISSKVSQGYVGSYR